MSAVLTSGFEHCAATRLLLSCPVLQNDDLTSAPTAPLKVMDRMSSNRVGTSAAAAAASSSSSSASSRPAPPPPPQQQQRPPRSPMAEEESQVKKNRPNSGRLFQQKLPAWQPILTTWSVIPTIFTIGALFIPIGVVLLFASESVREWSTYYDQCSSPQCTMTFELTDPFKGDVYFYYGLENYFQNHRRYMKSRSDRQLLGDLTIDTSSNCAPYDTNNVTRQPIAPCGAIANSLFNDTFMLQYQSSLSLLLLQVPMTYEGLVWSIDKTTRFRNPTFDASRGETLCSAFQSTARPPNWQKDVCELDPNNPDNNGFLNVDFIVWMRTAALPDFRKPYRALDRNSSEVFRDGLPPGIYTLIIRNNYPVSAFSGKKSFIISTASWAGGKNNFLGIAYIVVGCICLVLGGIFLVVHWKFGHSMSEMGNIIEPSR